MAVEQGVRASAAAKERREAPAPATSAADSRRLTVEIRDSIELGPDDAAAFEALIEARPHVGVFLSRAWLSGLFEEAPNGVEPCLVLLRDAHALVGAAPIAVRRMRTHARISLLGGGVGSDRVDLLAARGFETACADAFIAWVGGSFGSRGYVVELRDVPAESALWGALHRHNAEHAAPFALQPRNVQTLPFLDLTESRAAATLSLAKHRRWLERRGRLRIETLHDGDEALAALETLAEFLHARWSNHPGGSALDRPELRRFHRRAIPQLLAGGRLRMIRLSCDMRTIAVFYGLAIGTWWGYYLAGYDREWAGRIHLGKLTLAAAIEAAARDGASEFDFLKGVERVKYHWPVRERSTLDADVYSRHAASQLSRAACAAREAAGALVKSARDLAGRTARS
jgi:CelD/BcsL family acetyltransferase involved in cellulose biosynthesis